MINLDATEELLKTLTIAQVADRLDVTADSLSWHIKHNGISTRDIKHNYAIEVATELLKTNERRGIARLTGFTLRKVDKYVNIVRKINKQKLSEYNNPIAINDW